ncbi:MULTISPECIES: DUF397 domain-containing protein [Streptomyces]|nr:DUF397 domain-containing protein [Streptomyces sp. NBC_01260]
MRRSDRNAVTHQPQTAVLRCGMCRWSGEPGAVGGVDCLEAAADYPNVVSVRDSKTGRLVLALPASAWMAFATRGAGL